MTAVPFFTLTSAIAQCGPMFPNVLYAYLYVVDTVFAPDAIAAWTPPVSAVNRAGFVAFVSPALRSHDQKLPAPPSPNFGSLFQVTFSSAAAWIASYSIGATTAMKSLICTTCAP